MVGCDSKQSNFVYSFRFEQSGVYIPVIIYYGSKWSWAEMIMGRNDPEPMYGNYTNSHRYTKMAAAVKFGKHLKELRLHLCQTSTASKGVR